MRTTVTSGETITFPWPTADKEEYVILPRHDTDKGFTGQWGCVTHQAVFTNNLQASIHEDQGDHEVVWLCFEHGPEVP